MAVTDDAGPGQIGSLFDRPLTLPELVRIARFTKHEAAQGRNAGMSAAVAFYREAAAALGFDSIDAMGTAQPGGHFKAWSFRIPDRQWHFLGQLVVTCDKAHPISRVNALLDWGNLGPSGGGADV